MKDKNAMSAKEHLAELRHRLIFVIVFLIVAMGIELVFSDCIMDTLFSTAKRAGFKLIYIAPQESIVQKLRVVISIAVGATIPIILYECVAFVSPVFATKEVVRRIKKFVAFAVVMFVVGVVFAFCIACPIAMKFLYLLSEKSALEIQISVEKYISLFLTIVTCLGIMFQIPVVCTALVSSGVLSIEQLKSKKVMKVYFITTTALSAILTPPDPITLLVVMLPMWALYPLSLLMCKLFRKERCKDGGCKKDYSKSGSRSGTGQS